MRAVYFFNLITIISAKYCTEITKKEILCDNLNDLQNVEVSNGRLMHISVVNNDNNKNTHLRHLSKSDLIKLGNLQFITIDGVLNGIDKGALSALSNAIFIKLKNNKIDNINKGDFENLNTKVIFLNDNRIKNINRGAFANLPNIEKIDLENNSIGVVSAGIFNNLNVYTLNLNNNNVLHVEDSAFHNMTYLSQLSLGGNKLTVFLPERLFNYATSITWLELQNNSLTYLGPETLHRMVSLEYLDISGNLLGVIQKDTFKETSNLQMLFLSRNRLYEIEPNSFPTNGLLKLFSLYVDHNHLTYMSRDFLGQIPKIEEMAIVGNPWHCQCLHSLLEWMHNNSVTQRCFGKNNYARGKVPVCIVPDGDPNECRKTVQFRTIESYTEVLRKHTIPYCQI